jgi:glycosyltransferase involved in cell wall biosynthesis
MNDFAIAITTYNRPKVLEFSLSQFKKYGGDIVIVDDCSSVAYPKLPNVHRNKERLGIAKSKNKCLSLLKDYKRIFLFDDDCFPICENWWKPYIDGGEHHYCYGCEPQITIKAMNEKTTWWHNTFGCCLMVDQAVLKKVGGMDEKFGLWGFEHAEFSHRIFNAGLIPYPYITPTGVSNLVWSLDMLGSYGGFEWDQQSSMSQDERDGWHSRNLIRFRDSIKNVNFCRYE